MPPSINIRVAAVIGALLTASTALAEPLLPVDNQGVLARGFALPQLGQARVLGADQRELRLALDWTNEYFSAGDSTESLTIDAETQRYAITARAGLGAGFDASLELPILITGGGVLDSTIQGWHSLWGLPDGGRQYVPNNRYLVDYQRGGQTLLHVSQGAVGFGDINIGAGWQAARDLALRASLKLPSGDAGRLTGGNPGGALWLDYDPFHGSPHWFGFVSAGGSFNARGTVLGDQQHTTLAFAGAGAGYRVWRGLSLMSQLYGHSHLYADSNLTALRRDSLQLGIGGRYAIAPHTAISLGFQEDLVTDSSPDFSIHLDVDLFKTGY